MCSAQWHDLGAVEKVLQIKVYFFSQELNFDRVKLSHKLEYACRVLAQLGRLYGRATLAHVDELAELEKIPANYLVQILNELRTAGLIVSKRGKQGGYALSRPPQSIGLEQIVAAVDGELLERTFAPVGHSGERVAAIWSAIGLEFERQVRRYTLAAFVVEETHDMYYI